MPVGKKIFCLDQKYIQNKFRHFDYLFCSCAIYPFRRYIYVWITLFLCSKLSQYFSVKCIYLCFIKIFFFFFFYIKSLTEKRRDFAFVCTIVCHIQCTFFSAKRKNITMLGVGVYCTQKFRMVVFLLLLVTNVLKSQKDFNVYLYKTNYGNVYLQFYFVIGYRFFF